MFRCMHGARIVLRSCIRRVIVRSPRGTRTSRPLPGTPSYLCISLTGLQKGWCKSCALLSVNYRALVAGAGDDGGALAGPSFPSGQRTRLSAAVGSTARLECTVLALGGCALVKHTVRPQPFNINLKCLDFEAFTPVQRELGDANDHLTRFARHGVSVAVRNVQIRSHQTPKEFILSEISIMRESHVSYAQFTIYELAPRIAMMGAVRWAGGGRRLGARAREIRPRRAARARAADAFSGANFTNIYVRVTFTGKVSPTSRKLAALAVPRAALR
ncbi:hypothetical protein EVAR_27915_1 [Eumeta japonica]|uniref:Uncharacterized protein n=1 Tax=Eumeta variegata TaxID=151549 RepID=A0A4C1UUZ4_EUMVA|nr:hypothetical protein EVAR_27915_1 [Eumeta japonica]